MWLFPCVERLGLEERIKGWQFPPYYYHYQLSHQKSADTLDKQVARVRDRQFFPLAPLASDHLSAFVVNMDNVTSFHDANCSPACLIRGRSLCASGEISHTAKTCNRRWM